VLGTKAKTFFLLAIFQIYRLAIEFNVARDPPRVLTLHSIRFFESLKSEYSETPRNEGRLN
jgi:hypothetical protein